MNELALFAGAGGGLLGSILLGWRTVCAVEIDPYCRAVLMQRQNEGYLEPFPIWDEVRTFDGAAWRGKVDVVTAGFPCQPFSVAGKRAGESDDRNLWPETIRVIREVGPRFALLENVPGLLAHEYFGTVLGDLAESGFRFGWRVLSAAELGAPHRRDRLWIGAIASNPPPVQREAVIGLQPDGNISGNVADAQRDGLEGIEPAEGPPSEMRRRSAGKGQAVADTDGGRWDAFADGTGIVTEGASEERESSQGRADDISSRSSGIAWWRDDPADRFAES